MHARLKAAALLGMLLTTASYVLAGPLNPPAGPVVSTGKTLTEVEPRTIINATNTPGDADSLFKITQPGSYVLAGNVSNVPAGKKGIEIAISDVTIDLNGFSIQGFLNQSLDGIAVEDSPAPRRNIVVRNGSVVQCGGMGVNLATTSSCTIERVHAVNNTGNGISVGTGARVIECTANNNSSGHGFSLNDGSTIANSVARANGSMGLAAGSRCTITSCTTSGNAADGVIVFQGCTLNACTAANNGLSGLVMSDGCTAAACTAFSNGQNGIQVGNGCTVTDCAATQNNVGIAAATDCVVTRCTATLSSTDGIQVGTRCAILSNMCSANGTGNGGAGIRVSGSDNRIDGNNCAAATHGIEVNATGNLIIKNTCSGNTTNWFIVTGNAYGPIVGTPSGASVNGNLAASALNTTDPNANFSY